jgi:hypothetical protein
VQAYRAQETHVNQALALCLSPGLLLQSSVTGTKAIASAPEGRRAVMDFLTLLVLVIQVVKVVARMGDDNN